MTLLDVLNGHSEMNVPGLAGPFFIKHCTERELMILGKKQKEFLEIGIKKGLFSEKDRELKIIAENSWSKEKQYKITELTLTKENLEKSIHKLFREIDKQNARLELETIEKELNNLIREKKILIGPTAEDYALREYNIYFIQSTVFLDNKLSIHPKEDFWDNLSNEDFEKLNVEYANIIGKLTELEIKKIAISPVFYGMIAISDANLHNLFGKPAIDLTVYQHRVFMFGKYYKSLIDYSDIEITDEILKDPDSIVSIHKWKEAQKKRDMEAGRRSGGKRQYQSGGKHVMGGEQISAIGEGGNDMAIRQRLKEKGRISFQECVDLGA